MSRTVTRLPRFADGWTPGAVAEGARLVLPLPGHGLAFQQQIDRLCAAFHSQPYRTAYLEATAPFLENVSILENIWVPLAWRRHIALAEVVSRARLHGALFGWSDSDLQRLLACRPGDLPPAVLACAALLRVVMMQPDWLLIEPAWFERPLLGPEHRVALMERALGSCRWLLLWPQGQEPLPPGMPWHTIQLEAEA